jgi:glucokinase
MELVAADIGGTHARFAIASIDHGRVTALADAITLRTAEHASLGLAWAEFAASIGRDLPRVAAFAVACPIAGEVLKMTNNPWVIRPATLAAELRLERVVLVNDFGAVGHAVAQFGAAHLHHIAGPDVALPTDGVIGIIGPGTGLGVAHVLRRGGRSQVIESEGGHMDFAPIDAVDDAILAHLRPRFHRVSAERVVSGPGLVNIYEALAALEGRAVPAQTDTELWAAALSGSDGMAIAALARFCLSLGSIAGDIALATGAAAMVIAGGIGPRIAGLLPRSGFAERFTAKGRLEAMLAAMPVKLVTHPQPGLFGAASAFAAEAAP